MPELPEVETTAQGLSKRIVGHTIADVWTNYGGSYFKGSSSIKDRAFYEHFREAILGKKVLKVSRRAKNVLIDISGGHTILIHMKMTGHLLYGRYQFKAENKKDPWTALSPAGLLDPYNRHIRFLITFDNGKMLALSDMRRFAKVTYDKTATIHESVHLKGVGPEPLEKSFTYEVFKSRLLRWPYKKIKIVLMDQTVIAGIGNIYADETLWRSSIHPLTLVKNVPEANLKELYKALRSTLAKGISLGGDSMSDYHNVDGEKGGFQEHHRAYRRTGKKCDKKDCAGHIARIVVGGRGTHYCPMHQVLRKQTVLGS
jgi:formamidopyrimidine-DNA glycosylase